MKQSPRCWNEKLCEHLKSLGFKESVADPCIFVRQKKELQIIVVYVDDLILLSKSSEQMQQLKEDLSHLGKLHYCLGISVTLDESSQTIRLNQSRYLVKILEKYGLTEANSVSTPADPNVKLLKDDGCSKKVDSLRYQSMVGSLLHAARATRPDIAQAVGVVSRFNAEPCCENPSKNLKELPKPPRPNPSKLLTDSQPKLQYWETICCHQSLPFTRSPL